MIHFETTKYIKKEHFLLSTSFFKKLDILPALKPNF